MDSIYSILAFYFLAVVVLGSATLVITLRNLVYCVLWLAVTFIAIAGLYMMLGADFLALVQILVYAGAVCIMMIFVIMLTQRENEVVGCKGGKSSSFNGQFKAAGLVAFLTALVSCLMVFRTAWTTMDGRMPGNAIDLIAELMLTKHAIPFEVVALLLLVALIGAIFLAREVSAHE